MGRTGKGNPVGRSVRGNCQPQRKLPVPYIDPRIAPLRGSFSLATLVGKSHIHKDLPSGMQPVSLPTISVIIVSHNTCDELRDCLRSLQRAASEYSGEVIVVDNASSDGSCDMVETEFRGVKLIRSEKNIGFAAGVNWGVLESNEEWCFVLNPDTWVPRGTISRLVQLACSNPQIAGIGCALTSITGRDLQSSFRQPSLAREFWNLLPELKSRFGLARLGRLSHDSSESQSNSLETPVFREVEAVSGAAMLVRKSALGGVGGFDEAFFLYHEEIDLCIRLRKAGWSVVACPSATVIHHDARATGYCSNQLPRNPVLTWRLSGMDLLWRKHKSRSAHLAWRRQTRVLLRIRAILISVSRAFHSGSARSALDSRRLELLEWIDRLAER